MGPDYLSLGEEAAWMCVCVNKVRDQRHWSFASGSSLEDVGLKF